MKVAIRKRFYELEMKKDVKHFACTYVKFQNTKFIYQKKGCTNLYRLQMSHGRVSPWTS
jgi:hypothetical protein